MIDFVLLWVDGNDPKWREEYDKYVHKKTQEFHHYRDWENLHFIFRAFENFTPWVRKIHFVTQGHLPQWMNKEHPKLNMVKHTDFIPVEYLPTFNSNAIEANLHRIEGLSEYFVLFNDDTFITKPLAKERFFKDLLPRDMMISNTLSSSSGVGHFVLNNLEILNQYFDKKTVIKNNFGKYFHFSYGVDMLRNAALLPWGRFTGFIDPHQPQPFLKSTFEKLWSLESKVLGETSASKFRSCKDTNQYLFRYWQLASGNFVPISMKDTQYVTVSDQYLKEHSLSKFITSPKYLMVCFNDSPLLENEENFRKAKEELIVALEKILPNKSSFEP